MSDSSRGLEKLMVTPGEDADLDRRDPAWDGGKHFSTAKDQASAMLAQSVAELDAAQGRLWSSDRYAVLVIFQALDAAGKDGTIRHVMSGVNPQGVEVTSFKQPSAEELAHDFLWRSAKALPERGRIGIFNRSYYEEVLAVLVHPEWLERQHLGDGPFGEHFWQTRYESINAFERHLDRSGTKIVKFFLHVSREEQRRRLLARLDDPDKVWKFSADDVAERAHWDEYMGAFEQAITATSTTWAPWYVIPADDKPLMRALVAAVIVEAIGSLKLGPPEVSAQQRDANERARRELESEKPN
ncbi:MAG TPA: polyphosphate kinase 2 family protein [Solirubrobacteraceae bacterium]|nr:polyphosphate kinase 2 family protein [Solirubrobacteraceae bacterium]